MAFMQLQTNTPSYNINWFILHEAIHEAQPPTLPTHAPHYEVQFRPAILIKVGERIFKMLTSDSHER
jgi:hypothetical protein